MTPGAILQRARDLGWTTAERFTCEDVHGIEVLWVDVDGPGLPPVMEQERRAWSRHGAPYRLSRESVAVYLGALDKGAPIGRVAVGIEDRVSRLRALGNGQVPAVAALAWEILT